MPNTAHIHSGSISTTAAAHTDVQARHVSKYAALLPGQRFATQSRAGREISSVTTSSVSRHVAMQRMSTLITQGSH